MKSIFFCILISISLFGFSKHPAKFTLTINYTFKNIEKDYDHLNKILVYIDGGKSGESKPKKESQANSLQLEIPKGKHEIKIENWSKYEDQWELHNKANDYTIDLVNTKNLKIKKDKTINIIYDLDKGIELEIK